LLAGARKSGHSPKAWVRIRPPHVQLDAVLDLMAITVIRSVDGQAIR
jgi:hypothetical protein